MATEIPTRHVTFNVNRRWKLHVSKDGFGVAMYMVKNGIWITMLQIYLFPATAIGMKVATSPSLHF